MSNMSVGQLLRVSAFNQVYREAEMIVLMNIDTPIKTATSE